MKQIFVLTAAVALAMSVAAQARTPKWVATGKSQEYPAEMYFVGIGMSNKSVKNAKEQAVSDVAKQISVSIKATTIDVQSEESFGSKSISSYEKAESRTRLSTSGRMEGVSVVETAKKGKTHYALAVLDKSKFASAKRARIAELRKSILKTLDASRKAASSGKIIQALKGIREIRILSNQIIEERRLLTAAAALTEKESVPVIGADLSAVVEKCVNSLRLEKVSGDGQSFVVGQTLFEPLVVALSAQEAGQSAPVPGVALKVLDEDGDKVLETVTMSDGRAEIFPAEQAAGAGVGKHTYTIQILLPVPSALKKQLKAMARSFSFEVISNPAFTNLSVRLPATLRTSQEAAEKKIWKGLKRADIQKDENAPTVLEMQIESKEKGRVRGLSENNTFIEVLTSANCVLKENDREVLSFELKPAKGMGSTFEKAFVKSLGNLKHKKNLPVIVEKLRGATATPKPKVAVFPFKNASYGADWFELSQTLTGMVITALINTKRFEIVERELLDKIMEEKKLGMSGLTDLSEDIQIAQIAGAQYLVVGTVSRQAGRIEADARLVSVEKGSAVKAANGSASSRRRLRELANHLVEELKKARIR